MYYYLFVHAHITLSLCMQTFILCMFTIGWTMYSKQTNSTNSNENILHTSKTGIVSIHIVCVSIVVSHYYNWHLGGSLKANIEWTRVAALSVSKMRNSTKRLKYLLFILWLLFLGISCSFIVFSLHSPYCFYVRKHLSMLSTHQSQWGVWHAIP